MAVPIPQSAIRNPQLSRLTRLLLRWFAANARDLPWRRTRDPYAIWVSEIMLQQTQVKTVIPYWRRWMRELPNVQALAKASPDKIHKLWEGLGYYTRVRNLQKAARQIVEKQNANLESSRRRGNESQAKTKSKTPHVVPYKFPDKFDDVLALPGIGRYTAGAICSIAFKQPLPILDGNVIRVLTRVFGIAENPREKKTNTQLWQLAEELVLHAHTIRWGETTGEPALARRCKTTTAREDARPTKNENCSQFNQSLMELGALVCTPIQPQCVICPVKQLCVAFRDNRVEELPNLGKRPVTSTRWFVAFVVERNGRFLVRQRPAGVVNAHLWEFPNVEIRPRLSEPQRSRLSYNIGKMPATESLQKCCGSGDLRSTSVANAAMQALGFLPEQLTPLCTVKHSITRYRITLEALRVHLGGSRKTRPSEDNGVWLPLAKLDSLAFTSAHRKVLGALKTRAGR